MRIEEMQGRPGLRPGRATLIEKSLSARLRTGRD